MKCQTSQIRNKTSCHCNIVNQQFDQLTFTQHWLQQLQSVWSIISFSRTDEGCLCHGIKFTSTCLYPKQLTNEIGSCWLVLSYTFLCNMLLVFVDSKRESEKVSKLDVDTFEFEKSCPKYKTWTEIGRLKVICIFIILNRTKK